MYSLRKKVKPTVKITRRQNGNTRFLESAKAQFLGFVIGSGGIQPLTNKLTKAGYKVKNNKGSVIATKGKVIVSYMATSPMTATYSV